MKTKISPTFKIVISLIVLVVLGFIINHRLLINRQVRFEYPIQMALFPRDIAAPTFYWNDKSINAKSWKITININGKKDFITDVVKFKKWKPTPQKWDSIIKYSNFKPIDIVVERYDAGKSSLFASRAKIEISISEDAVGAPILFRQIPLPTTFAERNIQYTSYDLCNVSSNDPPHVVLGGFAGCGTCHSFSHDGKTIALDFDAVKRDKGGYFVAKVDSQINFNKDNYMSWSKLQGKNTFGLLSKISNGGRYVATTIKDRVIFKKFEGYSVDSVQYSQLFFPVNGVLAVYDRETKKFFELPGANDTSFVQSNPVWTPDDKYIIFARAKGLPYPPKNEMYNSVISDTKLVNDFVKERRSFKFDLYIIPFNDGKGGKAMPIKGASDNGKSNYFPAISPDGKWIVYCQANNFMMLRPDSKLFIVPVEGGASHSLESNFKYMNSWHSWSPNGKWLVYSSKAFNIYTDMFLTHIDEKGKASIPVLLQIEKRPNCAVNYPEFVNIKSGTTFTMNYNYINTNDIETAIDKGNIDKAKQMLVEFFNQQKTGLMPIEYNDLGLIYKKLGDTKEAAKYYEMAKNSSKKYNTSF